MNRLVLWLFRSRLEAAAAGDDAIAAANGWTVEVRPDGTRTYRDPRYDALRAETAPTR